MAMAVSHYDFVSPPFKTILYFKSPKMKLLHSPIYVGRSILIVCHQLEVAWSKQFGRKAIILGWIWLNPTLLIMKQCKVRKELNFTSSELRNVFHHPFSTKLLLLDLDIFLLEVRLDCLGSSFFARNNFIFNHFPNLQFQTFSMNTSVMNQFKQIGIAAKEVFIAVFNKCSYSQERKLQMPWCRIAMTFRLFLQSRPPATRR